jgi:hypothetical protein
MAGRGPQKCCALRLTTHSMPCSAGWRWCGSACGPAWPTPTYAARACEVGSKSVVAGSGCRAAGAGQRKLRSEAAGSSRALAALRRGGYRSGVGRAQGLRAHSIVAAMR